MLNGICGLFTVEIVEKLTSFGEVILEENHLLHLVSQTRPEKEIVKQIVDSAALMRCFSLLPGCRLLDVGSGAGFPGIVIKIIFPRIELISLDSSPKKIAFQRNVCRKLGIDAEFVEGDLRRVNLGAPVDMVVVKAVGSHAQIVRRSRDWLRPCGVLIFMEGAAPNKAIARAAAKYSSLSEVSISFYDLPEFESTRHLAMIYKK